jgi:serine/threonine protein kinase
VNDETLGLTADGRYQLVRTIAQGAMGVVYEARHQVTGRRVALKRMFPEHVGDDELRMRFRREARALGASVHPSVVSVLDAITDSDDPYIALELLEGRTLEGLLLARGMLSSAEAVDLALELCNAVAAVHAAGVIHRDIKPSNVYIVTDVQDRRTLKLIDFGIAAFAPTAPDRDALALSSGRTTMAGAIVGTPEYMAAEQLQGRPADTRADVYAIGVTLFEMLTGTVPFAGTFPEVLSKVLSAKAPPSVRDLRPELPEPLAAVITSALRPEPAQRFQSVRELVAALEQARVAHAAQIPSGPASDPQNPTVMLSELGQTNLARALANYRRRFARVPYVTQAVVHMGGETISARTEDISEGGVLLITGGSCRDGQEVEVELALPSSGTILRLPGVARWARAGRRGKAALGVEFGELPPNAHRAIRALVARLRPEATELSPGPRAPAVAS